MVVNRRLDRMALQWMLWATFKLSFKMGEWVWWTNLNSTSVLSGMTIEIAVIIYRDRVHGASSI